MTDLTKLLEASIRISRMEKAIHALLELARARGADLAATAAFARAEGRSGFIADTLQDQSDVWLSAVLYAEIALKPVAPQAVIRNGNNVRSMVQR